MRHIHAIDVSSKNDIGKFVPFIETLKQYHNNDNQTRFDTICWAETATPYFDGCKINYRSGEIENRPSTLIPLLAEENEDFVLHIFTYGTVDQQEVDKCKKMLKEYNLSEKMKSIHLYFPNDAKFNINFADIFSDYNLSIRKIAETNKLQNFFQRNDIDNCIAYLQKNYTDTVSKIRSQVKTLITCSDSKTRGEINHSIKQLKKLKYTEVFDNELECDEIYNDSSFNISKPMCIAVRQNAKPVHFTDQEANKIAQNPFNAFNIIEKALNSIEPKIMKYDEMLNSGTDLKYQKYFMLHNDEYNYNKMYFKAMIKHNNYVLSTLFDHELPGKKVLWQIIFLYLLARKVKPLVQTGWKETLFSEIIYISNNDGHYLFLDNFKEPTSYENLRVCFWFLAEISHKAFPDSNKNMYKSWENMPQFLQFYKDIFNSQIGSPVDMNQWKLWRLFNSKHNLTHLLSHFYGFKQTPDGTETVLFHDLPVQEAIKPMEWIKEMGCNVFISMYEVYWKRKNFSYKALNVRDSNSQYRPNFKLEFRKKYTKEDIELLNHVKINMETGRPYVYCQVTERHWKKCIQYYDVKTESNIKLFRNYCTKKLKYPDNAIDLLAFKRDTIRNLYKHIYPIFHSQEEKCMEKILKIYQNVMNKMPFHCYLERIKKPMSEKARLRYENCAFNSIDELNVYCRERNALFEKIKVYTIQKSIACITIGNFTMDLFKKIDKNTRNEIMKYLTPSSFGQGKYRIYNESVRKSFETTKIELNFQLKCDLDGYIVPYKLVLYEEDCFFDWHLDTHERGLLGTFIIELNSDYEGGELILKSLDNEIQPFTFTKKDDELIGCFFPHDIPHKVENVINGYKISLIFKVYKTKPSLYAQETKEYSDPALKELVEKIDLKINDVVWCSDSTIINYLKENNKYNIYEVIALNDVDLDTFIYPKKIYHTIRDEEDMYEEEIDSHLEFYCKKIKITNIIYNKEIKQKEQFRYLFGNRGNSPCSEPGYTHFYDGYAILHKDNPANIEMLKEYNEYKREHTDSSDY